MSTINVLFDVPEHIGRGLADGTMRLFGGTVRKLGGQIVAHLAPGKLLSDAMQSGKPFNPSMLASAIGHAQSAAVLASGVGAVNLAVNAAGFALMHRKLNAIMNRLDKVQDALDAVQEDVDWLKSMDKAHLRGDIDSACDLASRATRRQDDVLFKEARTNAHKVRRRMVHRLDDLLKRGRIITHRHEFAELIRACIDLASVEASCDEPIEGPQQAAAHLTNTAEELADLVARFDQQVRNYSVDTAARILLGPGGAKELVAMTSHLQKTIAGLRTVAGELEFRSLLGISADRWREMTAPEGGHWVTCVVPVDTAEPDLLAAGQPGAGQLAS